MNNPKDKVIRIIEDHYPIDSEFQDTRLIGNQLLLEAIIDSGFDWRDLPLNVLENYSRRCINRENCFTK